LDLMRIVASVRWRTQPSVSRIVKVKQRNVR
jgi:hypothetical protein